MNKPNHSSSSWEGGSAVRGALSLGVAGIAFAALATSFTADVATAQVEIHGFVEGGTGVRLVDQPDVPGGADRSYLPAAWSGTKDFTLRETRVQLKGDLYGDVGEAHFVTDLLADQAAGSGSEIVIREGYVKFNAFQDKLEARVGRQPTTWGTGDLLFINDLFPKDYVSFFTGRDDQYLKGPSDAIRLGVFGLPVALDVVYTPEFTPDNLPTGERLVFWAPALVPVSRPSQDLENGELAVRISRYLGGFNLAGYVYRGFWKQPNAMMVTVEGVPTGFYHPELRVYGASARGGFQGGVAWVEGGYYDSSEDPDGILPTVPNSELRAMAGYERQWWSDFTGGAQVYWEGVQDFVENPMDPKEENRVLLTLRLMQMLKYQTVKLNAFTFYSPTDEDAYVRLGVTYDYTDQLQLNVGANLFSGSDNRTLFGMNEDNSNVFGRVRFSF
ncbi:MAG: hypothetical protein KDA27_11050 [Candidatus Eisenbacteria bacterium]|uniref:Porin n=1 Tax=Eiseniibacteriota bacterium TaxID=2212470 RepID=A0A956NCA9_UNCEI|nr:hypothetical protein [Candidatus Eisenbacteria bacterium]